MKPSFAMLTACTAIGIAACSRAPFDPVSDLKLLASRLTEESSPSYSEVKVVDVRKTDSLVTPFEGTISGWESARGEGGKLLSRTNFVMILDYTDGKWAFRQCTGTHWTQGQEVEIFTETAGPKYAAGILRQLGIAR